MRRSIPVLFPDVISPEMKVRAERKKREEADKLHYYATLRCKNCGYTCRCALLYGTPISSLEYCDNCECKVGFERVEDD